MATPSAGSRLRLESSEDEGTVSQSPVRERYPAEDANGTVVFGRNQKMLETNREIPSVGSDGIRWQCQLLYAVGDTNK
jgi:hypothetical protein